MDDIKIKIIKIYQAHLPYKLIKYTCFKCQGQGFVPDWKQGGFLCARCGQPLRVESYRPNVPIIGLRNKFIQQPPPGRGQHE